ncbi:patatin-like phospholipase family protein [Acuticoccus kandeliae]|uniref:patatin-like phospholipase family protein n=1 Tax=Acuticoccus kandeliae TaxID=2073160 RepID=UPI000D3ED250|nr:patatin-like phospholipase family protein [Acuticoccus kandeliae]
MNDIGIDVSLRGLGQVVLVLQGGGALGAYQAGCYEALHKAGIEPDWVIGTSIGAINAALIAGNAPEKRLAALRTFWDGLRQPAFGTDFMGTATFGRLATAWSVIASGLGGFFQPNPMAFSAMTLPMSPENAGYYSTRPLRRTLGALIDHEQLNAGSPRLTVGAANVATAQMRYFDSRNERLTLEHVVASGSLPPAFPAVRIDGALYWDGGVLSNTPVEAVFDDRPRRDSIVFAIHMWRPEGDEPRSIWEVTNREKDLRYTSRVTNTAERQRQIHRLRHVIAELTAHLPQDIRDDPKVKALSAWGCTTRMHVVRLLAPRLPNEDHLKDIDFTASGIERRWTAGLMDMSDALARKPWLEDPDPLEGLILHEIGTPMAPSPAGPEPAAPRPARTTEAAR